MPDILIRGMEMPGSCAACDFYNVISGRCTRTGTKINFSELTTRSVDCPISELPPHGDLIDVSKISLQEYEQAAHDALHNGKGSILYDCGVLAGARAITQFVRRAPVIVPAEKGETQ